MNASIFKSALIASFHAILALALNSCSHLKHPDESKSEFSFRNFSEIEDATVSMPEFTHESWTLSNGLKVYFVNDPELPLVSSTLFIPGGTFWEKAGEKGLYRALGDNMRSGGTRSLNPQELDLEIEKYAATVSSSFDQEFGTISSSSLSTDFDKIFGMMTEVLLHPRFDRQRLSLWKGQNLEAIKRRADDPNTVASLSMRKLLIGESPYGSITDSQDITAITRPKLRKLHARAVIPNNAILAISGNISRQEAANTVNRYLGKWQKAPYELEQAPRFPKQQNRGIFFIEQPLPQSTILMGQLGPGRFSEDQFAIEVFNQYFGAGGFGALLTKRIRSELGLAYGIFGSVIPGLNKGRALIHLQTKPESSGEAIYESLKSLQAMKNSEISSSALQETKNGITNTFIFNFTSPAQVLARHVQFDLIGYPENYDQKYLDNIRAVSSSDIMKVAQSRWNFDEFVIVIVGPKESLISLEKFQPNLPSPLNSAKINFGRFNEVFSLKDRQNP